MWHLGEDILLIKKFVQQKKLNNFSGFSRLLVAKVLY